MDQFQATIEYRGAVTALMSKRVWNRQVEEPSWLEPLQLWKQKFRPLHFGRMGARRYGYTERSGENATPGTEEWHTTYWPIKHRVLGKKFGRAGHLRYSGQTEHETERGTFRLNAKRGKYVMSVSKARLRARGSQVDMEQELTELTTTEMAMMLSEKRKSMLKRLRAVRHRILSTPSWSR